VVHSGQGNWGTTLRELHSACSCVGHQADSAEGAPQVQQATRLMSGGGGVGVGVGVCVWGGGGGGGGGGPQTNNPKV
jgi:hypothetical protein